MKKRETTTPVLFRLYSLHRNLIKKHAKREKVKQAEIVRRAIEEYDLTRQ